MSMSTTSLPDTTPYPSPPALPDTFPLDVLDPTDPARDGAVVPSKGLEWSFVALAIGVLGLVFFLIRVIDAPNQATPRYERESRITPMEVRSRTVLNQPDLGAPAETNRQ